MKSMKTLLLAMVGLTAIGMAGSALAQCPTDPAQSGGGAWTTKSVSGGGNLAITSPGLATTNCTLQVSLNQGSTILAKAFVNDTSPVDELRYRGRFYISTSEVTGLTTGLRSVKVFNASAATSPANVSGEMVQVQLTGTLGAPTAVLTVADATQGSKFRQVTVLLPNAAGPNRIEFDLQTGASGSFRYWVSTDTDTTTDGSPTGTVAGIDTTGWSGVTQANLGMFAANNAWRSNYGATTHLYLDEFDSRRQTFIGK